VYHSTLGLRVIKKKKKTKKKKKKKKDQVTSPDQTDALQRRSSFCNDYRVTSLIGNSAPLGPYSRNMSRALWWS